VVEYLTTTLLLIVAIKNFENQLIFGEDIDKSKVARFLWPTVYLINHTLTECIQTGKTKLTVAKTTANEQLLMTCRHC